MPLLLFFAYLVLETVPFWGVAKLIGIGWALLALFVTMFLGMSVAFWEVRRLVTRQVFTDGAGGLHLQQHGAGKMVGNVGLTVGGGLLLSAPGFVSTVLGLLLILPPTRALVRTLISIRIMQAIESAGVRFYAAAHRNQPAAFYGSFAQHPENFTHGGGR